jgi:uncharacterized protein (TIGR04255 family)
VSAIRLPKLLEREPLVDAVFEMRLGGDPHMADLLPGVFFGQYDPRPKLQRLPAAEIPQPIRAGDPNLAYSPVIRLDLPEYTISFGDRNLVIGCRLPYPKWPTFKAAILAVVDTVARVGIAGPVERYSLKYVNLIQASTISDQIAKINMAIRVGDVKVHDNHLSVKVHKNEDDILHIMSIVTGAKGKLADGEPIFGAIVDIDSIRTVQFPDIGAFAEHLEPAVESLRQANKIKFFSCLTELTINEMGPKYD